VASLENVQGANNSQDVNLGNVSSSNDTLSAAAMAIAKGREAGWTDEETLGVLSRRRRHQRPIREDNREIAEAKQRFASITSADGTQMPGELDIAIRSLPNERVQFEQDGRERDQSVEDAYYGRDENEFTRWDKDRGTFQDVYIKDGLKTPDDLRDQALLRSYGINRRKTGQEKVRDRRGRVVTNQQGEVMMRNTYDFENVNETTAGQGWQQGGGRAAADAYKQLEVAIQMGKITPAEAAPLMERLRRTADPQYAKQVETREGRKAVIMSGLNFDPLARQEHNEIYAEQIDGAQKSINLQGVEYIPGALTSVKTDPDTGVTIPTLRAEPDSIFGARPQAVIRNEEAVEVARSLGDDVSAYVDIATGEGVEGVTPSRLQTNLPNTSQQVNAPVTTAASWIASNLAEGKTGDVLRDTNTSQITADFSRRVEAAAPGYRSRPVRTVDDFATQIQRVISARQDEGKNFYEPAFDAAGNPIRTKAGRQKQNKVANPGIPDVLRLLRMSSGEQGQLANALYSIGLAGGQSRPVSSFSPGVTVTTGSMFGEKTDVGIAGRDTQRAAFARGRSTIMDDEEGLIDMSDAQKPQIGSIRKRDEFGGVTEEEPPLTRAVYKGRSSEEAEATYRAQRAKNGSPVDEEYAAKIRNDNASLRADQIAEEGRIEARQAARVGIGGQTPEKNLEDDQFFADAAVKRAASERKAEGRERLELIKLIKKGAQHGAKDNEQYGDRIVPGASAGRKLDVPTYNDPRLQKPNRPEGGEIVTPGRAANLEGIRTTSGDAPTRAGRVGEPANLQRGRAPRFNFDARPDERTSYQQRVDSIGIAPELAERSPVVGGNAVTPPAGQTEAVAPDAVSSALKREIAARLDQKRMARRRHIGGAVGAGAGLSAVMAALNGGQRQEEEQYR
jgi:hypothetical protein